MRLLVALLSFHGIAAQTLNSGSFEGIEKIAGYQPATKVRDHNYIDLDVEAIKIDLGYNHAANFLSAETFYKEGAFSRSYAEITLVNANGITSFTKAGTPIVGANAEKKSIFGTLMEDLDVGATVVKILYNPPAPHAEMHCRVGALGHVTFQQTNGCFAEEDSVKIGEKGTYSYTYVLLEDNKNGRTLQKFSTDAEQNMLLCDECPHRTFEKFFNYYDVPDYGDRWIKAAFEQSKTSMVRGNADFEEYIGPGRAEAVLHGIVGLNVWMQVIRKMEEAVDKCGNGHDDAVHAWDQAVAYYTGSREGEDGNGTGVLLHELADARCAQFKTCVGGANENEGRAAITMEIFRNFHIGQDYLARGSCKYARDIKTIIEDMMVIPLIQGVLYAAYFRDRETDNERLQAEGATHAAMVLPLMHACHPGDAANLYEAMKVGSGKPNFVDVKHTLERHYECMVGEFACASVGGLYDNSTQSYYPNANPCGQSRKSVGVWVFFGLFIPIAALAFGIWFVRVRRKEAATGSQGADLPKSLYPPDHHGHFT